MLRTDSRHGSAWLGNIAAAAVLGISLVILLLLAPAMAQAKTLKTGDVSFPSDSPCVSDNADLLDDEVKQSVTDLNAKWEKGAEGAQIAVVTVDSLPADETIENYSMELAEHIKPGQKDKDNGLLYLIVKDTHQDRLEVGYGLESKVTDAQASDVLDDAHGYFKQGDYPSGVKAVLGDLDGLVSGTDSSGTDSSEGGSVWNDISDWFLIIVFIICPVGAVIIGAIYAIYEHIQWAKEDAFYAEWRRNHPTVDKSTEKSDRIDKSPFVAVPKRPHEYTDDFDDAYSESRRTSYHHDSYYRPHAGDDDDDGSSGWSSGSFGGSSSHFGGFGGGSFGGGGSSGSW